MTVSAANPNAMKAQWNRDSAGDAFAGNGVSAAMWDFSIHQPIEIDSLPDPHTYIVSFHQSTVRHESFMDGKLAYRQPTRPGTMSLVKPGQSPRAILSGGHFGCLHLFVPANQLAVIADQLDTRCRELRDPSIQFDALGGRIGALISEVVRDPSTFGRMAFDGLTQTALAYLLDRWSTGGRLVRPTIGGLAPWQVRRTTEYLHDHLDEDVSLATLAGLVNLSPFHFARAFKQSVGSPPHAYHCALRLEEAKRLLVETDHPITDIALAVGYDAPQTLARVFRRDVGVTPTDYRRERRR